MAMVRCPECGRVTDGTVCYACGYEWPAASEPAPPPSPPPAAAPPPPATPPPAAVAPPPSTPPPTPPKPQPPPIEDIGLGFEMPPAPPASESPPNPFATPRPVTGAFPGPSAAPGSNPFTSADGPLAGQTASAPEIPQATEAAPMAFDPFEGDSLPSAPPPPPLDLESEPFGEEVAFDDLDDLDEPPPPPPPPAPPKADWDVPTESATTLEPTELLPRNPSSLAPGPEENHDPESSLGLAGASDSSPGLLTDGLDFDDGIDVDDLGIPDVPSASGADPSAADSEPLSERLLLLAAELDAEGRHDDANLLHEAVRALASDKR